MGATALNRADLIQRQGKYPPPPGASHILGLEVAGVVTEVGGHEVDKVNLASILMKRLQIMGSTLRARSIAYKAELIRSFQAFAWEDMANGSIKPVIDSVYHWELANEAHLRMENNENAGKIVLAVREHQP